MIADQFAKANRATDARPDPHARRNGHLTGGVPQPTAYIDGNAPVGEATVTIIDPIRGQVLDTADADSPAEGTGLLRPDALSLGMLAADSPYIPDVADYVPPAVAADWLSDGGRNELDAVRGLLARMARECPGVNVRVAISFGVSRLADGTDHVDHHPGWELTAWRGTQTYSGSGQDLGRLAGICAGKFTGSGKGVARG